MKPYVITSMALYYCKREKVTAYSNREPHPNKTFGNNQG